MSYTRYTNCHLIDNGEVYHNTDLWVDNASRKICAPVPGAAAKVVDLKGQFVAPGFIDIQNNGIYGLNFSNLNANSSESDIRAFYQFYQDAMAKYLSTGVTATCPTVTSNFPEVYEKVLPFYGKSRAADRTDSLGAHVEGPFINIKKKGCHPVETFVDAKQGEAQLNHVYGGEQNLLDNVCILTAAPEMPGVLDIIPAIKEKNITFSLGHTMADHATGLKAIANGATMITHLYNAMPQPHHRDAGVVGLITSPTAGTATPFFGLICDGVHVDPSMAVLAYKASPEKCVLVTDAMHLIGLPDGTYKWDAQYIVKDGFRLVLKGTDTLAGAATTLPACIRNLMKWAQISLAQAVKTVTNNAAVSVGLQNEKGFLNPGCDADFVILNDAGYVQSVYKLNNQVKSSDLLLQPNQTPKLLAAL